MHSWAMPWHCLSVVNLPRVFIASLLVMNEDTSAMCPKVPGASMGAVLQWLQCMTWQILHHSHVHFPVALIKRGKIYRRIEGITRKLSTPLNFDSFQRKDYRNLYLKVFMSLKRNKTAALFVYHVQNPLEPGKCPTENTKKEEILCNGGSNRSAI